ncbi:hypothetical protein J6590_068618, partial [Homalodisca vitripennis]
MSTGYKLQAASPDTAAPDNGGTSIIRILRTVWAERKCESVSFQNDDRNLHNVLGESVWFCAYTTRGRIEDGKSEIFIYTINYKVYTWDES